MEATTPTTGYGEKPDCSVSEAYIGQWPNVMCMGGAGRYVNSIYMCTVVAVAV